MSDLRQELIEYSEAVLSGEIVACQKHKWACTRFLNDLAREGTDEFPYLFSEELAERFIDWMRLFKHRKGVLSGQLIEPHSIQKFVFGNIYGWIYRDTGYRRFNKAYWQVGRKNAKSQSLGCVGTYELMALGEGAAEVYCAATKSEQAKIVWKESKGMLEGCADLKGKYKVAYGTIVHMKTGSEMKVLSKQDRKEGDGSNPQCGIIDEYHAHDTSEIYDIIDSGMIARAQPLLMIITTAGFELNHPCYAVEYKLISKILDPDNPYDNDNYFVMVNELDKDLEGNLIDDIRDESKWIKANPIACSYPEGVESIRKKLNIALEAPEKMRDFLTKNMDVWVNQRVNGYMLMNKWALCGGNMPDLTGKECYVGIDLSKKIDLTSVGFVFPLDEDRYAVKAHSFIPEDTVAAKRHTDKVDYDLWAEQKWLTMTSGAVVDYRFIQKYIKDVAAQNNWIIKEICYDPYNATQFANEMTDDGFTMVEIRQGVKTLTEPTTKFREAVYQRNVYHDNNPVLGWAVGNAVTSQDHNENILLDKAKSSERIDPIAAVINAMVRALVNENNQPVYEKRGMRSL